MIRKISRPGDEYLEKFTRWLAWDEEHLPNSDSPGIYAIAISEKPLGKKRFTFRKEIVYFGMSKNLKERLKQFNRTLFHNQVGHGGAERFRGKYEDNIIPPSLKAHLYVSVMPFQCDRESAAASEPMRRMGQVAYAEWECIACYMDLHDDKLPEFNDKARSKKHARPRLTDKGKSVPGSRTRLATK